MIFILNPFFILIADLSLDFINILLNIICILIFYFKKISKSFILFIDSRFNQNLENNNFNTLYPEKEKIKKNNILDKTKIFSKKNLTKIFSEKKESIFENIVKDSLFGYNAENRENNKLNNNQYYQKLSFEELLNKKLFVFSKIKLLFPCLFIVFLALIFGISYFVSFELGLAILIIIFMIGFSIVYLPKIKKSNNYSDISKELPYALRQLGTELRSGKGLYDSLVSVVNSDYGILSLELSRVLEEINYGESTENAFLNLSNRVGSDALSRAVQQIIITLKIGANLAVALNIIAEDLNFDIQNKLKDYAQKLNAFIMIYTFIAILGPVLILIMILAASAVIGDFIPNELVLILYGFFFPLIIVFLIFMVKKLEPKI